ncbi:MAG: hypothetical protein PHH90_10270 [Limnochordia bacterium]|nr:hypothetical protein [Limnochordia bacterium]
MSIRRLGDWVILLVAVAIVLGLIWSIWSDGNEVAVDTDPDLVFIMEGFQSGNVSSLVKSFSNECGGTIEERTASYNFGNKLVTLIMAGEEFLPDVVIMTEEHALELVKTDAFVNLEPLFEQVGIDINTLPAANSRYPAVWEGKQVFLAMSLDQSTGS